MLHCGKSDRLPGNSHASVVLFEFDNFLPEVKSRIEWLDLFFKAVNELLSTAYEYGRNVVDRFVRIEGRTLTTYLRQRHLTARCTRRAQKRRATAADQASSASPVRGRSIVRPTVSFGSSP